MRRCAENKNHNYNYIFWNYAPLKVFVWNRVRSITLKPLRYFHKTLYKYKTSSDDVPRLSTITLPTLL